MFGFFKKKGSDDVARPEVELRETFRKLQGANQIALIAIHININKLYEVLDMEERIINLIMPGRDRNRSAEKQENFEYLTKIFQMSKNFEERGMSAESVAANLIALFYACHIVDGTLEQSFNQQAAKKIFDHFRHYKTIDLNPPRRGMPPM